MSIAAKILSVLKSKEAGRKEAAQTTWDKLVSRVHAGGSKSELTDAEIDALTEAAEQLGIANCHQAFADAVETLERQDRVVAARKYREGLKKENVAIFKRKVAAYRELIAVCNAEEAFFRDVNEHGAGDGDVFPLFRFEFGTTLAPQARVEHLCKSALDLQAENIRTILGE
jgi:hypothetical protein